MTNARKIEPVLANAIIEVIEELASEIDLYYEDSDIAATGPTIRKMETLVAMLVDSGYPAPETYVHVADRLHRTFN
jgi:hypothetical protein